MNVRDAQLECIVTLAGLGPVTLPGIAQRYRLPVSAAWSLVQTLLKRGVLVRGAPELVSRGRPRRQFVLAPVRGDVEPHLAHITIPALNGIIRAMKTSPYDAVHAANQTEQGLRYTLSQYKDFPSLDGGGYSAKLREHGKVIGWVTDHGHGGPVTVHVEPAHLDAYNAHLARIGGSHHDAEMLMHIDLVETHDMEKRARKGTPLRLAEVDDLDCHPIALFSVPNCTAEQLVRHPQITTDHTHYWVRGRGWTPLR